MKNWTETLTYSPCREAREWLRTQPDAATAWQTCQRGDWMLFHAGKLAVEPGCDARRTLVLAACACARLALPFASAGDARPLAAIETAESWARGGPDAPTLDKVRSAADDAADAAAYAAAYAADAAAYAAAYAADAANAAYAANAANAANAAANAAADAADAADARENTLARCADIVRSFYPEPPCAQ